MNNRVKILNALQAGANRTREIAERTGIKREIVQVRVCELRREKVVSSYAMRSCGKTGRPEKFYRISA